MLRKSNVVYGATTSEDALQIIEKKKAGNNVYVITNVADPMFIYSATRSEWGHVYDQYTNVDSKSRIEEFVQKHLL